MWYYLDVLICVSVYISFCFFIFLLFYSFYFMVFYHGSCGLMQIKMRWDDADDDDTDDVVAVICATQRMQQQQQQRQRALRRVSRVMRRLQLRRTQLRFDRRARLLRDGATFTRRIGVTLDSRAEVESCTGCGRRGTPRISRKTGENGNPVCDTPACVEQKHAAIPQKRRSILP